MAARALTKAPNYRPDGYKVGEGRLQGCRGVRRGNEEGRAGGELVHHAHQWVIPPTRPPALPPTRPLLTHTPIAIPPKGRSNRRTWGYTGDESRAIVLLPLILPLTSPTAA